MTTLTGIMTKTVNPGQIGNDLLMTLNYLLYGPEVPVSVQGKYQSAMFRYFYMIFIVQIDG